MEMGTSIYGNRIFRTIIELINPAMLSNGPTLLFVGPRKTLILDQSSVSSVSDSVASFAN